MSVSEHQEHQGAGGGDGDEGNGGWGGGAEARLLAMTIIYCNRQGEIRRKDINVDGRDSAGALVWTSGVNQAPPHGHQSGDPPIPIRPGTQPETLGSGCRDSTATASGTSCCWWDGSKWVCPDDFE